MEEDILSDVVPSNIMLCQVCTLPPALVFVVLIVLSVDNAAAAQAKKLAIEEMQ